MPWVKGGWHGRNLGHGARTRTMIPSRNPMRYPAEQGGKSVLQLSGEAPWRSQVALELLLQNEIAPHAWLRVHRLIGPAEPRRSHALRVGYNAMPMLGCMRRAVPCRSKGCENADSIFCAMGCRDSPARSPSSSTTNSSPEPCHGVAAAYGLHQAFWQRLQAAGRPSRPQGVVHFLEASRSMKSKASCVSSRWRHGPPRS